MMMAADSLFSKTQTDVLRSVQATDDIVVVENTPSSLVQFRVTTESGKQNDIPEAEFTNDVDDKRDKTVFPAILEFRSSNSNTAKSSTFGLLSEGFYSEKDTVDPSQFEESEGSHGMSSVTKSLIETDEEMYGGQILDNAHKSNKKKNRKAKKKSSKTPVLRRSQTSYHMYHLPQQTKSTNGASKVNFNITAQGNITADLTILTAKCKAVKIHQHFEPKSKISTKQNSFTSKTFSIVSKPTENSNQRIVSKSTNVISESRGGNSKSHNTSSSPSPVLLTRKSLSQAENVYLQRVTKVYLSEKHSGVLKEEGKEFPCAPPATPTPDQLKKYEYIPSLTDVRSQRAVRQKLQVMERKEQHKEDRRREEQAKVDRALQRDKESELRRRQRQEIYALNKIMTELEHKRFLEFCKSKGIEP